MSGTSETALTGGATTLCRCWAITRADGVEMGFTDHDRELHFDGIAFRAETGLTASALQQSTGLSVDNTEAIGALSDASLTDADIDAGRYDGAAVRAWLVNWADPNDRRLLFRGEIGELRRSGGQFEAELRGLSAALNRPLGRVYQKPCGAVLGDGACRFDTDAYGFSFEVPVRAVSEQRVIAVAPLTDTPPDWFRHGRLSVLSGAAQGLSGLIREDLIGPEVRELALWQPVRAGISPGDRVRIEAGCDKRLETCRAKFSNVLNYQGFPDIPGDEFLALMPRPGDRADGGSRRS